MTSDWGLTASVCLLFSVSCNSFECLSRSGRWLDESLHLCTEGSIKDIMGVRALCIRQIVSGIHATFLGDPGPLPAWYLSDRLLPNLIITLFLAHSPRTQARTVKSSARSRSRPMSGQSSSTLVFGRKHKPSLELSTAMSAPSSPIVLLFRLPRRAHPELNLQFPSPSP